MPEIIWVIDYEADVEADFLRFYGIYDYENVASAKYLRLARRLFAYEGVLVARYMDEQEQTNSPGGKTVKRDIDRTKMYRDANVQKETVTVKGKDYLAEKLASGKTL